MSAQYVCVDFNKIDDDALAVYGPFDTLAAAVAKGYSIYNLSASNCTI